MGRSIAVLVGTGYAGEDVLQKETLVRHLKDHAVHAVSRIDPSRHLDGLSKPPVRGLPIGELRSSFDRIRAASTFHVIYDAPELQRAYTPQEVRELESWLGTSFLYLASMDRRFFDARRQRDRRRRQALLQGFAGLTAYFRAFYEKHKTDAIVNTVEDDAFDVVAYAVARRMNVRVLGLMLARFPRRGFMVCEDFRRVQAWNPELPPWETIQGLYSDASLAGGGPTREGYWDVTALAARVKDAFFAGPYRAFRRRALRVHPVEALIVPRLSLFREGARHVQRVFRRYAVAAFSRRPRAEEPYLFFPLHYTQDAQITFREPLLDQFRLVRNVARALPHDVRLYVKPHPFYYGTDLSLRELRRLARLSNVRLLPSRMPPQPLLRGSRGVVTVNSTSGFEALARGLPVVTVGHDFYCDPAFAEVVHDGNELAPALARALQGVPEPRKNAARDFVRTVYANTVWIEGHDYGYGFYGFTDADGEHLAAAFDRILGRAGPKAAPEAPPKRAAVRRSRG